MIGEWTGVSTKACRFVYVTGCLTLKSLQPRLRGPSPGGVGCRRAHAGRKALHPAVERSSVDRTGTQLRTPRAIAATRQQCATTAWRMRNRAYERNRRSLSSVVPGCKRNREPMYADQ